MNKEIEDLLSDATALLEVRHDMPRCSLKVETEELSKRFEKWASGFSEYVNILDGKRDEMETKLYDLDDSCEAHDLAPIQS
jgi:hypothetical protein